jgi:hypothetical protein
MAEVTLALILVVVLAGIQATAVLLVRRALAAVAGAAEAAEAEVMLLLIQHPAAVAV